MRILRRYVLGEYLITVLLAVLLFSFVMSLAAVVRLIDYLARGASARALLEYFVLNLPFLLQYALPMSALTAALLVVGRMSMEGEITALRACGISVAQIGSPIVLAAMGLALVAFGLVNWVAPESRFRQRMIMAKLRDTDPLALLEEGRFVREFPGLLVYVGRKGPGRRLQDVVIYDFRQPRIQTHIRARAGEYEYLEAEQRIAIRLEQVRMERTHLSPEGQPVRTETAFAAEYPQDIDVQALVRGTTARRKISDYTGPELVAALREGPRDDLPTPAARRERMLLLIELNSRMATAFGCFALPLLGVPLGLRSHRRESYFATVSALALMFVNYLFMIMARELAGHPEWRPDLIPWVPVIAFELIGLVSWARSG